MTLDRLLQFADALAVAGHPPTAYDGDVLAAINALAAERDELAAEVQRVHDPRGDGRFVDQANEVFEYWRETCDHPQATFTGDRRRKVLARVREGVRAGQDLDDVVAKIKRAIDGAAAAAFVNDQGRKFDDLELICRTGSKLDSFVDRAPDPRAGEQLQSKLLGAA